jgi:hypothetical protein
MQNTQNTAWAHLHNAALIDKIIADVAAREQVWINAWDFTYREDDACVDAFEDTAYYMCVDIEACADKLKASEEAKRALYEHCIDDAGDAASYAIDALIAWDNSSNMFKLAYTEVRKLAEQNNAHALMLETAVLALAT